MTDPVLDTVAALFPLPEEAVPLSVTVVFSYLDEDSEPCVALACGGGAPFTDRLGGLVWAQHQMLTDDDNAQPFEED